MAEVEILHPQKARVKDDKRKFVEWSRKIAVRRKIASRD
jgi:hypothetical protein